MRSFLVFIGLIVFSLSGISQVKVIFDTDFGGDADDLGALAMLYNFVDSKECDLQAVMLWTQEEYAVPAIDGLNRYYGHPNIPIGVRKGASYYEAWNYNKAIADNFEHKMKQDDAEDAVILYRKLLAKAEDKSLVIITVGPLANIQNLINSKVDAISPLNGKELIEKKVKEFVVMGGQFPSGEWEWNFNGNMPGVTKFVIENLNVPITFSGYEVGVVIKTGEEFNTLKPNHPLHVGFMHFSENAEWIKGDFNGEILNNATYDQTAVYYAIRDGVGNYWEQVENGRCIADEKGGNTWNQEVGSNHNYLKLIVEPEVIGAELESIMMHN